MRSLFSARLPNLYRFILCVSVYSIDEAMDSSLQQAAAGIQLNNYVSSTFPNLQAPYHGDLIVLPSGNHHSRGI